MSPTFCRGVVSLLLAPWLVLSATLAPEHVHESSGPAPHAFAHRHVQPHEVDAHHHNGAEIDPAHGQIVWVDGVGACQATYELPMPCFVCLARFQFVPAAAPWTATLVSGAVPLHGPPRPAHSLRAPPASVL